MASDDRPWEEIELDDARALAVGLTARWRVRIEPWTFEVFDIYESRWEDRFGALQLKMPKVMALSYRESWCDGRLVREGRAWTSRSLEPAYWRLGVEMERVLAGRKPKDDTARPAYRSQATSQTTLV